MACAWLGFLDNGTSNLQSFLLSEPHTVCVSSWPRAVEMRANHLLLCRRARVPHGPRTKRWILPRGSLCDRCMHPNIVQLRMAFTAFTKWLSQLEWSCQRLVLSVRSKLHFLSVANLRWLHTQRRKHPKLPVMEMQHSRGPPAMHPPARKNVPREYPPP